MPCPAFASRNLCVRMKAISMASQAKVAVCSTFMGLSRSSQIAVGAAALLAAILVLFMESKKRSSLIMKGDKCMDFGDTDACGAYDDQVASTPTWKLKLSLPKLPMTNVLGAKLSGSPAPDGYSWGNTY